MRSIAGGACMRWVLLALLVAACRGSDAGSGAGGGASASASAAPRPVGDPRAPLPAPLAAPEGDQESAAWTLAHRVRGGGDDAVPALLTALRLSGIGVRAADGALVVDRDRPYQGFVIEAWEVRPLAALARENRLVLVTLGDMADVVRAAVPALKDAPVERMILDGLRAHAYDDRSGLDFWTQFIVAIGRQLPNAKEPDLLAARDPKAVVLDGLQASLILRRLGTDLLVLTEGPAPRRAALAAPRPAALLADRPLPAPLRWFAPTPLHAAMAGGRECTLSETTQKILDLTAIGTGALIGGATVGELGFPGLVGYLKGHLPDEAVEKLERTDLKMKGLAVLLAYAQFVQTYMALETTIDLDAPPLRRTKARTPQSGERKNLVATLRMNVGDKQMVNCFRIMLNSVGLDFSLPNDGPAKGAKVAWTGIEGFSEATLYHGGPEAIVQFADDPANRIQDGAAWRFTSANAVINQTADENGIARIAVEGRGQRERVPASARPVRKYATVGLDVALKGADLFGDLKDATGTALAGGVGLLTMPLELLYRMKWYTAATLTFPVQDWGEGGGWSGKVTVTVRSHQDHRLPIVNAHERATRFTQVDLDFTDGVGSWRARETRTLEQSGECALGPRNTSSALSGSGPAWLQVGGEEPSEDRMPRSDGGAVVANLSLAYSREGSALGLSGLELSGMEAGTALECEFTPQGEMRSVRKPYTSDARVTYYPLGSAYGAIPDPREQLAMQGTLTSPFDDAETKEKGTVTVSWNLWRQER